MSRDAPRGRTAQPASNRGGHLRARAPARRRLHLADEVGLGKTIEAGLVMAQLRAEGARRILLIAPKSLLGQWRQELFQLFDLETREGSAKPGAFAAVRRRLRLCER